MNIRTIFLFFIIFLSISSNLYKLDPESYKHRNNAGGNGRTKASGAEKPKPVQISQLTGRPITEHPNNQIKRSIL